MIRKRRLIRLWNEKQNEQERKIFLLKLCARVCWRAGEFKFMNHLDKIYFRNFELNFESKKLYSQIFTWIFMICVERIVARFFRNVYSKMSF